MKNSINNQNMSKQKINPEEKDRFEIPSFTENPRQLPVEHSCDVLVLGSGIAGVTAAVRALEHGARVILACKGRLFSGSSFYPGTWGLGLVGPEGPEDEDEFRETICDVGRGMADPILAGTFVRGIHPAVGRLEQMGVKLRKAQGGADQREYIPCFDHKHRGWNGIEFDSIRKIFSEKLREAEIFAGWEAIQLVQEEDRVCGAVISNGTELSYVAAGAVVLATGGYGSLFRNHLCTTDVEGVGQALALNAGCTLVNMEFMQMMPGYLNPAYGTIFNEKVFRYSCLTAEGRKLLPEKREDELLELRSGHGPFTSCEESALVDLAIAGAGYAQVRYDPAMLQHMPEFVKTYFDWLAQAKGLTPEDPVKIGIFSHAANGGILIDENGWTGIKGLFAAGEATGGMHGADRIGGLSTANGLVFGEKAGLSGAEYGKNQIKTEKPCKIFGIYTENPRESLKELQEIMSRYAMLPRSEEGLNTAIAQVQELFGCIREKASAREEEMTCGYRLYGQMITALTLLHAQRLRRESRGSHYREDYPEENPELEHRILERRRGNSVEIFYKP